MSKIKKTIIILCLLMVITIIVLIIILININNKNEPIYIEEEEGAVIYELEEKLQVVENRTDFYTVKEIINKYYLYNTIIFDAGAYYETDDKEVIKEAEQNGLSVLYNMLDSEYIEEKGVEENNIKEKLAEIKTSDVNIRNMYVSQKTSNINVYVVKGTLKERVNENIREFQIIVKVDAINKTFSIIPQEHIQEKYDKLEIGEKIEVTVPESIQENKNNIFKYKVIADETHIKNLFSQLKSEIQYSEELVYNKLDKEYRNKTFETIEDFQEYTESNKQKYSKMQISQYQKTILDDYTQYICVDKDNNYYIFNETAPFQYTLMLDNYAIPTEDFAEEYNKNSEAEKVILNIKRFFMGINDKNYGYSYSVLSEAFKDNKYPTKNDFINYAKQNFFDENEIEYESYEKENGVYIYKIKIKDATGKDTTEKEFNIIIKLNSGTDFEMSFGQN